MKCDHENKTPKYDHIICDKCGWINPGARTLYQFGLGDDQWFPSMVAFRNFITTGVRPWEAETPVPDAEISPLLATRDDYKAAYEDTKRLARLIDVAMHGEEGAAEQASLCDLVDPARQMREALEYINKVCSEADNPNGNNLANGWVDMADMLISEVGRTAEKALGRCEIPESVTEQQIEELREKADSNLKIGNGSNCHRAEKGKSDE